MAKKSKKATPEEEARPAAGPHQVRSSLHTYDELSTANHVVHWLFHLLVCYLSLVQAYTFVVDLTEVYQRDVEGQKKGVSRFGLRRILNFISHFIDEWLWQGGDLLDLVLIVVSVWTWWCAEQKYSLQEYLQGQAVLHEDYHKFDNGFIGLARATDALRQFTGFLVLLCWIWLAKIMRRLGSVGDIVFAILATVTAKEVMTFGGLFMCVLIGYWQSLYCIFGPRAGTGH
eukprot:gene57780-biopygen66881